jgi:glycosyltransferase involved in cell wall biosynthesis
VRLIVTIPVHNEEEGIDNGIAEIPRIIDGADEVLVLVIADGCTDDTVKVAQSAGADRIVSFRKNRGLAKVFQSGIDETLAMDADMVVNIYADGQYVGQEMGGTRFTGLRRYRRHRAWFAISR